jgi:transposase
MDKKVAIVKNQGGSTIAGQYGQKKLIKLRAEVNRLYFEEGLSKNAICRRKRLHKGFVIRWTQSPRQDFTQDNRGWPMGQRRKWTQQTERRIAAIHAAIKADPKCFYLGASAIQQQWLRQYPGQTIPPLRTIGQILKDLGLSGSRKTSRNPGASAYLCYPEYTVYHKIGRRVMEADFVGQKFLAGRTEPLHFAGFSFKASPKLRYYKRIRAKGADSLIQNCKYVFKQFEKPDAMKLDNAADSIGSRSGKRNISKVMAFLLANQVYPIFAVPRRPFSQASIEGNNSVFARKFWNQRTFESLQDVDRQLNWFNAASLEYTSYKTPETQTTKQRRFVPKVYFLRQVRDCGNGRTGWIEVLNEVVELDPAYIGYFVIAQWHLLNENLTVYIEKEKRLKTIISVPFEINETSKKKFYKGGALSFCI